MHKAHTFHIPVLGVGFSFDTPVKVARFGISSVISLVDDVLAEQVREYYCKLRGEQFTPIDDSDEDARARRLTAYLNLVDVMVRENTEALRSQPFAAGSDINTYFELLPDDSELRARYRALADCDDQLERQRLESELRAAIQPGDIDVNIMVKVDRDRHRNGEKLPAEHGDAMAALRGYANSNLESSIVLSAGFNRRLTKYIEQFADFQADSEGRFKKKVVLKVSDFRSALTQARMFARGGVWISEYRIESGLNCGGHTFDGDGSLMGPILEEFKLRRDELYNTAYELYQAAVAKGGGVAPARLPMRITAQGGVGTAREHTFLLRHYDIDAVGWGSPFLLVPESVNIDPDTLEKLASAGEDDIVSSGASPLGVRFSNLVNSKSELNKRELAHRGTPGSNCPKGYLKFNTEFTEQQICTASRLYQQKKLAELETQALEAAEYELQRAEVLERACLCRDLSGTVEINYGTGAHGVNATPAVCPGPNLAFFSRIASLQEMVDHIYGRINLVAVANRPHMFVNELKLCIGSLARELTQYMRQRSSKGIDDLRAYRDNLLQGIEYYRSLIASLGGDYDDWKGNFLSEIADLRQKIDQITSTYPVFPEGA